MTNSLYAADLVRGFVWSDEQSVVLSDDSETRSVAVAWVAPSPGPYLWCSILGAMVPRAMALGPFTKAVLTEVQFDYILTD